MLRSLAAASLAAATAVAAGPDCSQNATTVCYGHGEDKRIGKVATTDPHECCSACGGKSRCTAYTIDLDKGVCFLLPKAGKTKKGNCLSGAESPTTPSPAHPPPAPPPPPTPAPAHPPPRWEGCTGKGDCDTCVHTSSLPGAPCWWDTKSPSCKGIDAWDGDWGCVSLPDAPYAPMCQTKCPVTPAPATPAPAPPPPPVPTGKTTMTTFHIMSPNYTGLANKNTGDPPGDVQFVLTSMHNCTGGDNRHCMEETVLEAQTVTVDTNWGPYTQCNVDGTTGKYICCDGSGSAAEPPCTQTASCLVGREQKADEPSKGKYGGFWYSFPACGEGRSWNASADPPRRVQTSCLGNAWRVKAGNCTECPGTALNACVRACLEDKLTIEDLELVWYNTITDGVCPDAPAPGVPRRALGRALP